MNQSARSLAHLAAKREWTRLLLENVKYKPEKGFIRIWVREKPMDKPPMGYRTLASRLLERFSGMRIREKNLKDTRKIDWLAVARQANETDKFYEKLIGRES